MNTSLHLAPDPAQAGAAVQLILEWETHRRALASGPVWHALYRAGLLAPEGTGAGREEVALRLLGFVPASPDGTAYQYDRHGDEVVNERHGSLRRPRLHARLAETSPLRQLLVQFRSVRADLRFREDGVHTAVTLGRWTPREVRAEPLAGVAAVRELGGRVEVADGPGGPAAKVDLAFTDASDAELAGLASLPRLTELSLAVTGITDAGLRHLKGHADLRSLDLDETDVTDAGLKQLEGLTRLRERRPFG